MSSADRFLVLVVDDAPDAVSFVHDALESAGMDVLVALDGQQALKIAERMQPDLILLDAVMPVMDGFETCAQLKQQRQLADIPVIFMTGLGDSEDIVRGLEAGGVDYLTKPVKPNELIARTRVHVANARLARSAYQVLDKTGQTMICLNEHAEQLWATPLAYTLLAKAGVQEPETQQRFRQAMASWLQHEPQVDHVLRLDEQGIPLMFKVTSTAPGEWVLRLFDASLPGTEALLKTLLSLTERESEVLNWVSKGKANREIAEILQMSPRTVNKHLEQIYLKLGVDNRTAAAGVAMSVLAKANALL